MARRCSDVKLAVLIVSYHGPLRIAALVSQLKASIRVPHDVFVVESGPHESEAGPHTTLWYRDDESRGKAFGHCLALQHARLCGHYDYIWVLSSELEFDSAIDPAGAMIALLEREPRMAIAAPTSCSRPLPDADLAAWKLIATSESLGFMMRMSAIDDVGFLNPKFRYGWGAMDELAYSLYRRGWFLARAQGVGCHYLPVSAHGQDLAVDEYWRRARRFAFDYYGERYGEHWDELFWSAAAGHGPEMNVFREHKNIWAGAFSPEELLQRTSDELAPSITSAQIHNDTAQAVRRAPATLEPWPLASEAIWRVLAWPDYSDEAELDALFDVFARALVGRSDACLCLRFEESIDGDESLVVERLERAYRRVLGAEAPLEVLLVDDELDADDLPRLGLAVVGFARLPSSSHGVRNDFIQGTQASPLADGEALRALLLQLTRPGYGREALDSVDFAVVHAIGELHPWCAPAVIGNLAVQPGHGTGRALATIEKLALRRERAIVAPIVERFSIEGARVLELGAGFGLYSAKLSQQGARSVVMVEERSRECLQAELYWRVNAFLPRDNWQLIDGSPASEATWRQLDQLGRFDIVLWTDALRHGDELSLRIADLARICARILVIDLSSPGGAKVTSQLDARILKALQLQGFVVESTSWTHPGMPVDEQALRSVLVAHRSKVVRVIAAPVPARAPKSCEPVEANLPLE